MIHWKNKPISELSRSELQKALLELMDITMSNKHFEFQTSPYVPFITGAVAAGIIAFAGLLIVLPF